MDQTITPNDIHDYGHNHLEHRIMGPPGTGKTTYLTRQIANAAAAHGNDNVLVASYTRTAAAELVSRDLDLPQGSVGTLHSLCYRAMGSPTIAETKIQEFNSDYPQFLLSSEQKGSLDEPSADSANHTDGDKMLIRYRLHRARMKPLGELEPITLRFAKAWEEWKERNGYVDFTDMISKTLESDDPPPGGKRIGFYDEAQDFNALEFALIRKWSKHQDYVILSGDDDQTLYSFAGASADAFLNPPVPQDQKRILSQSWRVPRKIHAYANRWIKQLAHREPKDYLPRDEEGELRICPATINQPHLALRDAEQYLKAGKSIMFLTSCGYMLYALKRMLRDEGIPFHNPFRKNRGDWNPLGNFGKSRSGSITAKDRFMAFLDTSGPEYAGETFWHLSVLAQWAAVINAKGIFKRGGKQKILDQEEFPQWYEPDDVAIFTYDCFEEHAMRAALTRDINWFRRNMMAAKSKVYEFPIKVYDRLGMEALTRKPQIIISTIHGVKGGEADVCYLWPDLSVQGMREWRGNGEGHDSVVRMMYVGMTRARESLILCDSASSMHVNLN